jgi:ATP/maltotriose-dependent transcriptional regulator MalT
MSSDARGLSEREVRVLQLAADGRTGAQIAEELHVALSALQGILDGIYAKLGVADRASAVAYAIGAGLVT